MEMREVIEETFRLAEKGEPCVLATVVRTKGMTPQKAGAKQLIRQDGSSMGTLGGGCVEGDIWYYAKEMMRRQSGPEFREYYLNEEIAAQDGLVCGGTMYFFIELLTQSTVFFDFANPVLEAFAGGPPVAVATVVNSKSPEILAGTRCLIKEEGLAIGSMPTSLQNKVISIGKKIAPYGGSESLIAEDGSEIYIESYTTPPTLVIMGGGHVGKSVYTIAALLGFRIFITDDRAEFCNKERFPHAEETLVSEYEKALPQLPLNSNTFILVATRGHRYDDSAIRAALQTRARYIGLLGSKRKNTLIFNELVKQGIGIERIKKINAPVGLNIGALTPEEIAVSIISEIVMHLRGGTGGSMKMSDQEIEKLIS